MTCSLRFARFRGVVVAAIVLGFFPGIVAANDTTEDKSASPRPGFHLGDPEMTKLDWNVRSLAAADLDGDKRVDLAVLNNDRARIDLLYQRTPGDKPPQGSEVVRTDRWNPVLEHSRFRKERVVTGLAMNALALGDLDGDGRIDLAYTGRPDPLTVRYQGSKGEFERTRVIEIEDPAPWDRSLLAYDVQGDGRDDLVVLTESELLLFEQSSEGELAGPRRWRLSDKNCYGLQPFDADRDGRLDLSYLVSKDANPLRVRLSLPQGGFGPERMMKIEAPESYLVPVEARPGHAGQFLYVQNRTQLLEQMVFEKKVPKQGKGSFENRLRPRVFSSGAGGATASYAVGDFDGDGNLDLAVGDGGGARVLLYFQKTPGILSEGEPFPALSGVASLSAADFDKDGKDELVLASAKEQSLGVAAFVDPGRLSYPSPLPMSGKPLAVAAGDLTGDGVAEVVALYSEKRVRKMRILSRGSEGWNVASDAVLDGLRTDPKGIRIFDADGDGRTDLAIFALQESMRLLLQNEDGSFLDLSREEGYRSGLVSKLLPSAMSLCDLDGDGHLEMIAAGSGFARALRVNEERELHVFDQFNARSKDVRVAASVAIDLNRDGRKEVLLVDTSKRSIQVLEPGPSGVYQHSEEISVGAIDLVESLVVDFDRDGEEDLLLFGKSRFWWFPSTPDALRVKSVGTYETDLRGVVSTSLGVGDLNEDGKPDVVAVDGKNSHVLQILESDGRGKFDRALHFTVFEADPHYRGRSGGSLEPRELLLDDLTGDGRTDLVILVHDRVLVYPQK